MSKVKVEPEKIHLLGIRVLKSVFEADVSLIDSPQPIEKFNAGYRSESGFNLKENYQLFRLFIKIQGLDDDKSVKIRAEYHIEFHFSIDNLSDFVTHEKNGDGFSVSSMLGATIAGISYSTARGMILDRTQTTDFNGVLLPVINPQKLLEEDTFS
ncbi:hypothetical protein [Fulvivirga ligni]|uniref:hypothetical protein n=1 Tax=Fulvivirga ligni TaxID=2904246 RepID=UPI001F44482E|nr:hypothetical protein [Fulvivirga ligni]UII19275.1 hypothetical protein LVD16_15630 [Fulvivirga ligni]